MSSRKVCSSTMLQDCSWSEGMSLTSLTLSHHLGLARALTSPDQPDSSVTNHVSLRVPHTGQEGVGLKLA